MTQFGKEVTAPFIVDPHVIQPEPAGHLGQFCRQVGSRVPWSARFVEGAAHQQFPARAHRLQVHPGHHLLAEQEGQGVIAVPALVGRGIDLDAVVHPEQRRQPVTFEDQRVEGRQQGPPLGTARHSGLLM